MENSTSFLNSNGLINGIIPAETPCPFIDECVIYDVTKCPNKEKLHPAGYSCAAARGFSLTKLD